MGLYSPTAMAHQKLNRGAYRTVLSKHEDNHFAWFSLTSILRFNTADLNSIDNNEDCKWLPSLCHFLYITRLPSVAPPGYLPCNTWSMNQHVLFLGRLLDWSPSFGIVRMLLSVPAHMSHISYDVSSVCDCATGKGMQRSFWRLLISLDSILRGASARLMYSALTGAA